MLRFVVLGALFCATARAETDYKQIFDDDSAIIGVKSTENYAVSAPELKKHNWASVDVNWNQLTMVTPECKVIEKNVSDLNEDEKQIIDRTTERLLQSNLPNRVSFGGSNTILNSNSKVTISGVSSYSFGDTTMQRIGDNHYSFRTESLVAKNIDWLMIDNDVVTFIFSDSRIKMRPRSCLDADERKIIQNAIADFEQAKAKSDKERQERDAEREKQLREREAERARYQQERERYQQEREQYQRQMESERQERYREREERYRERQERYAQRDRERQQRYQSRGYY